MTHPLIKKAQQSLPANAPKALKDFVVTMYGRTPPEDLEMLGPALLADTARRHWDLMQGRRTGEIRIDVHTPPLAKGQGGIGHTTLDIVQDDTSFIIDSVTARLAARFKPIHVLVHPILHVARDRKGKVMRAEAGPGEGLHAESHMHIQLQGTIPDGLLDELKADMAAVLHDVHAATGDWQAMRKKLRDCREALSHAKAVRGGEGEEYLNFLDYIYNDNFTLLGYREYRFADKGGKAESRGVNGSGLGLLRDGAVSNYLAAGAALPQAGTGRRGAAPPLVISKINRPSSVHRPVPMDAVAVRQYGADGRLEGEALFLGLFTSVTYSRSIQDIPLLRRKTDEVVRLSGFREGSHNYKALRHILEKYPRDELFQIGTGDLYETALGILRLQKRQRIALYMRPDPFGRYVSCLAYVPRDRYDTRLRVAFERILEKELDGKCVHFYTTLDDSPLARVMFSIEAGPDGIPRYNARRIEALLQEAGREWDERLAQALVETLEGEEKITDFARRYGEAFPAAYRETYLPKQAVYDIGKIEEALGAGRVALDLYRDKTCGESEMRLKIYNTGRPIVLSDVLPLLENMGLRVLSELPFDVRPLDESRAVWIHDFTMSLDGARGEIGADAKEKFEETLARIWYGDVEDDSLNALVLKAGMGWREVMVLRSYVRYMRQMGYQFGMRYIEKAVTNNAEIAGLAVSLFETLHDPDGKPGADRRAEKIAEKIAAALEKVRSLDEDRILRTIVNLVQQTLRTNYFQTGADGMPKTWLSLKLNSREIAGLPEPRPYREIFVYSRRTEGVHLRGDVIARGGIRWSDRQEDFRTEILGLMKAQQVKNSIIVPMGAKGGFVVKNPPAEGGREAYFREGVECYKTLVRGLLDITDNRAGDRVVPPSRVVRRDGDDPYLVVAADKGTATFSDIANGLSAEYGFWLGDAFASGGSAGYDHKKMGITARGAWESVKRHFRELGHDTQSAPFDVVGVGDMGGDVFGNGMLLSRHIRLIGAFNHAHIFCDPDPDAAASFAERERLFKAVKGWDGYDTAKLSKGGRIYLRTEKSLRLTPEIRARFGIDRDDVSPSELMAAMLKARTDLLWFGGIGTYIKSSTETHADAGDRANEAHRIDAGEIRAKVVGEGANLAVTQRARIEYALRGGKINADFIDNSGGVDSSDHEVNIKILLGDVTANKKHGLTLQKRNSLLASMTGEVAALVLRNSYQQTQGISLEEHQAADHLPLHAKFIRELEKRAGLKRHLEGLPDEEEIEARQRSGKGLTRPELGILQAHAKILFSRDVLASDILDEPDMLDYWLVDYFPVPLRTKYRSEILRHRLHREIMATTMANSLVNRMGPVFMMAQTDRSGASCADVTRAYIVARESFRLRPLWDMIESLDGKVPAMVQMRALRDISRMMDRETAWFLTRLGRAPDIKTDAPRFRAGIEELGEILEDVVTPDIARTLSQKAQAGVADGLPRDLARHIAAIPVMASACDIIRIAAARGTGIGVTAQVYFDLGERFRFDWLRRQAAFMKAEGRWSAEALDNLAGQLDACQAELAARVLKDVPPGGGKGKAQEKKPGSGTVVRWMEARAEQSGRLADLFSEMQRAGQADLPMLVVAEQSLRRLCGG